MYMGMDTFCCGTIMVASTQANARLRKRNLNRAKPYPAIAQTAILKSVPSSEILKVAASVGQKSIASITAVKFSAVQFRGIHMTVGS